MSEYPSSMQDAGGMTQLDLDLLKGAKMGREREAG
jgi:hypothetical protein